MTISVEIVLLYMAAGAGAAFLILMNFRPDWANLDFFILPAVGLNAIVGLFAYFLFRRPDPELLFDRVLLILGYVLGVVVAVISFCIG